MTQGNVNPAELAKFDDAATRWWDPESEFRPLHLINPLRLDYIAGRIGGFNGRRILDIGCGGGLLAEGMANRGAEVLGIDLGERSLRTAQLHALESGVDAVRYECIAAEDLAEREPAGFDAVTCLEMLEHVPDPGAIIDACAKLVRPGGHVIFSTLDRTLKSWALGVVAAEYILGMLPRGTHDHQQFIRPSELARWARAAHLDLADLRGITYHPLTRRFTLSGDTSVNYLAHFTRPMEARPRTP